MNTIEREFSDTLQILSDFKENAKYLVAFSGGTDSLALLSLTVDAVGKQNVVPVYVNHNLRNPEELKKEIELNITNCNKLGVQLVVKTIEPGMIVQNSKNVGVEAVARKKRYSILEEERVTNSCDFILTAHHKNDQIETVLMKIISNAPITGLRGISEKWNNVLRPLLEFSKKDLEDYLAQKNLTSSFDSTNNDNKIKRNEIRNIVIPELKQLMLDCEERILGLRNFAVSQCKRIDYCYDSIELCKFNKYDSTQKMLVLYQLWDNVLGTMLPQKLIDRVISAIESKSIINESSNGGTFYSYNGILFVVNDNKTKQYASFSCKFEDNREKYFLPNDIIIERKTEGLDTDISIDFSKFVGQPYVRFAKETDTIKLKDGTKTIGKLLQDMKIPAVFRSRVPVVVDDEGLCIVFGSCFGGKNRICGKIRTSLALNKYNKYICYKGNYAYEENR